MGENWFFYGRKHFFNSEEVPLWKNFTENKLICQVNHRTLAMLMTVTTTALLIGPSRLVHLVGPARKSAFLVVAAMWAQYALGVTTILNHVPVSLASAH